jgi:acetyl-CoA carboxylase carboxyltransferase component
MANAHSLPASSEHDQPLRIARTLFLYLAPDGQLSLWLERAQLAFDPWGLQWICGLGRGASIRDVERALGTQVSAPELAFIQELCNRELLAPAVTPPESPPSLPEIQCHSVEDAQLALVVPMNEKLRIARSVFIALAPTGQLALWVPNAGAFYEVDVSTVAWLTEFGHGTSPDEVEKETGRAFQTKDRVLLGKLVKHDVLVPAARSKARVSRVQTDPSKPARGRIEALVDAGSFVEDGRGAHGTVTGTASIDGRTVAIVAYSSWGGARFSCRDAPIKKVLRMQETAMRLRCPVLYLFGEGGPSEAGPTLDSFLGKESWGRVYHNMVELSGRVPQLGVIFGSCSMPSSFPPALCDALILVDKAAFLSIAPPQSVKRWLGEEVDRETLGGATMHCRVSGMGDFLVKDEPEAIARVKSLLSYLPSHCDAEPPRSEARSASSGRPLGTIIPPQAEKPFDMMEAIQAIVDQDSVVELKRDYAKEMITAFARLDGRPVGVIANNSRHRGGILFPESCEKEMRFVSLCDAYGIPLLFLVDCPGYMIGSAVEKNGLLRATARLYTAIVEATVPKITVVVRKAHTGGIYAMCGPFFNPDHFLALPSARIAILGSKASYDWLTGAEKALPPGPWRADFREHIDARCRMEMNPLPLAPQLAVDGIIDFDGLRTDLTARFERLRGGRVELPKAASKKHAVVQM